ncbi:MAG: hypothetical protein Q9217_006094 [Psora testacea]
MVTTRKSNGIEKPSRKSIAPNPTKKVKAKKQATVRANAVNGSPNAENKEEAKRNSNKRTDRTKEGESSKATATLTESAIEEDVYLLGDELVKGAIAVPNTFEKEIVGIVQEPAESIKYKASATSKGNSKHLGQASKLFISKQSSGPRTNSMVMKQVARSAKGKKIKGSLKGKCKVKALKDPENVDDEAESRSPREDTAAAGSDQDTTGASNGPKPTQVPQSKHKVYFGSTDKSSTQPAAPIQHRAPTQVNNKGLTLSNPKTNGVTTKKAKSETRKSSDSQPDREAAAGGDAEQAGQSTIIQKHEQQDNDVSGTSGIAKRKLNARNAAIKVTKSTQKAKPWTSKTPVNIIKKSEPRKTTGKSSRSNKKVDSETCGPQAQVEKQPTNKGRKKVRVQDPTYRNRPAADEEEEDEADYMIEQVARDPSTSRRRKKPRIQDPTYRPHPSPQTHWSEPSPQSETHASVHPARDSKSKKRSLWKAPMDDGPLKAYANDLRPLRQKGRARDPQGPRKQNSGALAWVHERSPPVEKMTKRRTKFGATNGGATRRDKAKFSTNPRSPSVKEPEEKQQQAQAKGNENSISHHPSSKKRRSVSFLLYKNNNDDDDDDDDDNDDDDDDHNNPPPHKRRYFSTLFQNSSPSHTRNGIQQDRSLRLRTMVTQTPEHDRVRVERNLRTPSPNALRRGGVEDEPRRSPARRDVEGGGGGKGGEGPGGGGGGGEGGGGRGGREPEEEEEEEEKESFLRAIETPSPGRIAAVVRGMIERFGGTVSSSSPEDRRAGGDIEGDEGQQAEHDEQEQQEHVEVEVEDNGQESGLQRPGWSRRVFGSSLQESGFWPW